MMNSYKCLHNYGYEGKLTVGRIYHGKEKPGIFIDRPFLVVYDEEGNEHTVAHLSRFEKVN